MSKNKAKKDGRLLKNLIGVALAVFLFIIFLRWLLTPSPLMGESFPIQSRDHIKVGASHPPYNSNPPTSGWHYDEPVKAGIYGSEFPDENFVHSLEHGYVIISYNCQKENQRSKITTAEAGSRSGGKDQRFGVWAHGEEELASNSAEASASTAINQSDDCRKLRESLENLAKKLKLWKIIVTPRKNLDSKIALSAWGRLDKFSAFDEKRIERFVNAYRDQGPEKTAD